MNKIKTLIGENLVWFLLLIAVIYATISNPIFVNLRNIRNLLFQSVALGLASVGEAIVILAGGFDLSIGSMISFLTSFIALVFTNLPDFNIFLLVVIVLAIGTLFGAINGILSVKFNIQPLIVTLGTMQIIQGAAFFLTKRPLGGIPREFRTLVKAKWLEMPVVFFLFLIILVLVYILLKHHRFGRYIYAVGTNEHVSKLSGIPTKQIRFFLFAICGFFAALAALYLSARMAGGGPRVGSLFELDAIAAVVIAGISLNGGVGKIQHVIGGVFILMIFNNIMNLNDIDPFFQILLKGVILILAVYFGRKKMIEIPRY
jgi:ribose transport system permease protein